MNWWQQSKNKISKHGVAEKTLECLKDSVPNEVPGIAFYLEVNQNWARKFRFNQQNK